MAERNPGWFEVKAVIWIKATTEDEAALQVANFASDSWETCGMHVIPKAPPSFMRFSSRKHAHPLDPRP